MKLNRLKGKILKMTKKIFANFFLRRKVQFIKSELEVMEEDPQSYVANPLNAFILVKTLSFDIDEIQMSLEGNLNKFKKDVSDIKLPSSDFDGAVAGLLLLQTTYELKTKDLVNGIVDGIKVRSKLSNDQIFTLGYEIIDKNHQIGAEYLEIAKESSDGDFKMEILEILLDVYQGDGKFSKVSDILNEMMDMQPENENLRVFSSKFQNLDDIPEPNYQKHLEGSHWTALKEKKAYNQACMMNRNKNATESSKLYCKLHTTTAFTKIAPLKLEIANFLPFVAIFHDVISDDEIEILRNISRKRLIRAGVRNKTMSNYRIAKLAWLKDSEHEAIARITRRVADMSGLNVNTSELLQVQNYGIGGLYNLHFDFSAVGNDFNLRTGNRIATTLFYVRIKFN